MVYFADENSQTGSRFPETGPSFPESGPSLDDVVRSERLGLLGQSSDRALTILSLSSLTSASTSAPVVRSFSLRLVVAGAAMLLVSFVINVRPVYR